MSEPLLSVKNLTKTYLIPNQSFLSKPLKLKAVDGVSFDIAAGETLGIVGESGCGKSTLAKCLARLIEPTGGQVRFKKRDFLKLGAEDLRQARRDIQFIFQDPYSSLNPHMTVAQIISETWVVFPDLLPKKAWWDRASDLVQLVGLNASDLDRYPHQFSGGQRQRIGIARALSSEPKLLICDEAVSALDVSVQAQVVNLFQDIQDRTGVALIFIAHDLTIVRHIANRTAVMYLGRVVEDGPSEEIFSNPEHPYTKALISAAPILDPNIRAAREIINISGEPPSPLERTAGCKFRSRCWKASDICSSLEPGLERFPSQRGVACHNAGFGAYKANKEEK